MKKNKNEIAFLIVTRQNSALRGAGYSAFALRGAGYSASALRGAGYSASDVFGAGYSASDVLGAGYSASDVLGAGYSASALRGAGYSASDVLGAGYSASALRGAGYSASALRGVKLHKPYTKINDDLKHRRRKFDQSTFGGEEKCKNLCATPMCIGGHLVSLAGDAGWKLKEKYGYAGAAALIHCASHPKIPCPRFDSYSDELALGFIRHMAYLESKKK